MSKISEIIKDLSKSEFLSKYFCLDNIWVYFWHIFIVDILASIIWILK
jgi:hypothetical protein